MQQTYYIVSGGFDPIHEGHIAMIKESAHLGNGVIILLNSDNWLIRKKGKFFQTFQTRATICSALKGVIDVLDFDDADNSACAGIKKAKQKYLDAKLIFANGGDRGKNNVPEQNICKQLDIEIAFGVGGRHKANSSSWILNQWQNRNK